MGQNYIPVCRVNGKVMSANFTNGNGSLDTCSIVAKRVDREWSSWISYSNRTGDEYFEYKTREILVNSAHGGLSGAEESWQLLKHLRIGRETVSWAVAVKNCEKMNGRLFSDVDGTSEQFQLLEELSETCSFWVGVEKTSNVYEALNGARIPPSKFFWAKEQPDNVDGPVILLNDLMMRAGFAIGLYEAHMCFVCDMM